MSIWARVKRTLSRLLKYPGGIRRANAEGGLAPLPRKEKARPLQDAPESSLKIQGQSLSSSASPAENSQAPGASIFSTVTTPSSATNA